MDLGQVRQYGHSSLIPKRDIDKTVVGQGAHDRDGGRLLPTAKSACGHKEPGILAPEATRSPNAASLVPEGLPLHREVTEPGWNAKEKGVVLKQLLWLCNRVWGFWRGAQSSNEII